MLWLSSVEKAALCSVSTRWYSIETLLRFKLVQDGCLIVALTATGTRNKGHIQCVDEMCPLEKGQSRDR